MKIDLKEKFPDQITRNRAVELPYDSANNPLRAVIARSFNVGPMALTVYPWAEINKMDEEADIKLDSFAWEITTEDTLVNDGSGTTFQEALESARDVVCGKYSHHDPEQGDIHINEPSPLLDAFNALIERVKTREIEPWKEGIAV